MTISFSNDELELYQTIFHLIHKSSKPLNKLNFNHFLASDKRNSSEADYIWNLVMQDNETQSPKKDKVFQLLKCVTAKAQGHNIESDDFYSSELALPFIELSSEELLDYARQHLWLNLDYWEKPEEMASASKEEAGEVKKRRMTVEMDDFEPMDPENFEHVEVPTFEETVSELAGPFGKKLFNTFKIENSDHTTTTSPKSLGKAYSDKSDKYDRFDKFDKFELNVSLENLRRSDISNSSSMIDYGDYLEQNQKIKIAITGTKNNTAGLLGYASYITYNIRSQYLESEQTLKAERRYNDFLWLDSYFRSNSQYKGLVLPILPEKKTIGNTDPEFVQQRKVELEKYLREISRHDILSQDNALKSFLGDKKEEEFESLKEKKPLQGIKFPELDWKKMKEAYEYALINMKVKFKNGAFLKDWEEGNEWLAEINRFNSNIRRLWKTLQKQEELYNTKQKMNLGLNILYTKIMNRAENDAYFSIASLSSSLVAQSGDLHKESLLGKEFIKNVKTFKDKMEGFKQSYALLISIFEEIEVNKELLRHREVKFLELKAENNLSGQNDVSIEIAYLKTKISELENDVSIIKTNLISEMKHILREFEVYFPTILNEFNTKLGEHYQKVSESWKETVDVNLKL